MVRYDVVPINQYYRGIGRSLLGSDLLTKYTKNKLNYLVDLYFAYLDEMVNKPSKVGLQRMIEFCNELIKNRIMCEIIAFDLCPINNIFGYSVELLGIDIVHKMSESLLSEYENAEIIRFLNENGLCKDEDDTNLIIPLLDHGNSVWEPCYVYKVIY